MAKSQIKLKICENYDQVSQKTGKTEEQEDKGNGDHHLRYFQAIEDKKSNCYNNRHQAPVSIPH